MRQVTVTELATTPDAVVIDVREPDEYASGHVPGANNIPLGQVRSRLSEVPLAPEVHLICQSGRRSAQATEVLRSEGVQAVNVDGGTTAWIQAGLRTEGQHR
jgi:rhodanese-related sulfurtransferase